MEIIFNSILITIALFGAAALFAHVVGFDKEDNDNNDNNAHQ